VATRRRAFGNIRSAGKTSWQASYKVDGQRFIGPTTYPTKADASAWLANVQADINRGVWIDPTAGQETLRSYVGGWLDRKQKVNHYRPRSLELVTGLLNGIILPGLGDRELSEIKTPLVRSWHADVAARRTPGQAAKAYRLLHTILGEAATDGVIPFNPCAIKGAGKENPSERPQPTMEMIEAIVDKLNDRCRLNDYYKNKVADHRYESLVWTAALSGLREGELFALERQDIDILHRTISVTKQVQMVGRQRLPGPPKSAAGNRVVTIPATLATMLDEHLKVYVGPERHALVFTSDHGLPMERSRWASVWRRSVRASGVDPAIRFHDLRHHAGTLAAQLGATTKELMDRLGHSTMRASLLYQYSTQERQREIADRMDQALTRQPRGVAKQS